MTLHRCLLAGTLALLAGAAVPGAVPAQSAGRGFLFREPRATLTLRGGFDRAAAGSDLFSFTTEQLTLGRGDFSGPTVGGDLAVRVSPRLDVVLGGAYAGMERTSEFRKWVDGDDLPIEQSTSFERAPITGGVRAYLTPRGRSVGQFAWIPTRAAAFVGAGAGGMWYRFHQVGDFVDFETFDVFPDELESSGWTLTAHGAAGLDYSITPRLGLTAETRYTWAEAGLSDSFEGFDPIDLSGLSATVGFNVRF